MFQKLYKLFFILIICLTCFSLSNTFLCLSGSELYEYFITRIFNFNGDIILSIYKFNFYCSLFSNLGILTLIPLTIITKILDFKRE